MRLVDIGGGLLRLFLCIAAHGHASASHGTSASILGAVGLRPGQPAVELGPGAHEGASICSCSCNDTAGVTATRLPCGARDSHMHVIDPVRHPPLPGAVYRPAVHTVWENAVFEQAIGCEGVVMVQPSIYGSDNSLLVDSLRAYGPARARGVVVIDLANTTRAQLDEWHAAGVRGVRINLQSVNRPETAAQLAAMLQRHADAVRPLGWLLELYAPMRLIPSIEATVCRLGARVVFDHLGDPEMPAPGPDPAALDPYSIAGFDAMVRLLKGGNAWVKVSGAYRVSKLPGPDYPDVDPVIRALFEAAPTRLVYGSDWPHTRFEGLDIRPWNQHLVDLTARNKDLQRRLFRDNACELWSMNCSYHTRL